MTAELTSTVSSALLCYCFADEMVGASRTKITGTEVPCRDATVRQDDLGALLFALALWDLQQRGTIRLEYARKKFLGVIPTTALSAVRTGDDAPFQLGQSLLNQIPRDKGRSVSEIVHRWYPRDVSNPATWPVDAVRREGVAAGYVQEVDAGRGAITSKVLGSTKLVPDCRRIAELRPEFDRLKERWTAYQAAEPEQSKALVDQCLGAMRRREERNDRNDL